MDGIFTTLTPTREPIGARPTRMSGLGPGALLAVAALHGGLIAGLVLLAGHVVLPPPPEQAVQMVFTAPPPGASVTALAAGALAPQAAAAKFAPLAPVTVTVTGTGTVTGKVTGARGAAEAPPRPVHRTAPARRAARGAGGTEGQAVRPVLPAASAVPSGASAPGPSADGLRALAGWEAGVSRAVQAAAIYPAAARLQHREGRAQVQFTYWKGTVERAAVVRSSQVASLDAAALAAVMRAVLPAPPAGFGVQARTMVVWVGFGLGAAE